MLSVALLLCSNIIAAAFVPPKDFGIIQTVMLLPTYFSFLQLGIFNGLGRELPFRLGMGDGSAAQAIVDSSWKGAKAVCLVGLVFSLCVLAYYLFAGYPVLYLIAIIPAAVTICTDPLFNHLEGVYRGCREFTKLGKALVVHNLVSLVASLLPIVGGAVGFAISRMIQSWIRIAARSPQVPMKPAGPGTWEGIRGLSRVGLPLLASGTIYNYLGVADRSLVAAMMGPEDVGRLTLSALGINAIQFIPVMIGSQLYPRISAEYGRTGSPSALRRYFWIGFQLTLGAVVPTAVLGYLFVGPFTRAFLPKYLEGIHAAELSSLGCIGFVYYAISGIIATLGKTTLYMAFMLVSYVITWTIGVYLLRHGSGIEGAAIARMIGNAVLCVATLVYAYHLTGESSHLGGAASAPTTSS